MFYMCNWLPLKLYQLLTLLSMNIYDKQDSLLENNENNN